MQVSSKIHRPSNDRWQEYLPYFNTVPVLLLLHHNIHHNVNTTILITAKLLAFPTPDITTTDHPHTVMYREAACMLVRCLPIHYFPLLSFTFLWWQHFWWQVGFADGRGHERNTNKIRILKSVSMYLRASWQTMQDSASFVMMPWDTCLHFSV